MSNQPTTTEEPIMNTRRPSTARYARQLAERIDSSDASVAAIEAMLAAVRPLAASPDAHTASFAAGEVARLERLADEYEADADAARDEALELGLEELVMR